LKTRRKQDHGIDKCIDWRILKVKSSIENLQPIKVDFKIQNTPSQALPHEISKKNTDYK
jgi:hypothetical protein